MCGGFLGILAIVGTSYRSCSKYQYLNWVMLLAEEPQLGYISGGELQFHKNGACDWQEVVFFSLRSHVFHPTHVHHPNRGWPRIMRALAVLLILLSVAWWLEVGGVGWRLCLRGSMTIAPQETSAPTATEAVPAPSSRVRWQSPLFGNLAGCYFSKEQQLIGGPAHVHKVPLTWWRLGMQVFLGKARSCCSTSSSHSRMRWPLRRRR